MEIQCDAMGPYADGMYRITGLPVDFVKAVSSGQRLELPLVHPFTGEPTDVVRVCFTRDDILWVRPVSQLRRTVGPKKARRFARTRRKE